MMIEELILTAILASNEAGKAIMKIYLEDYDIEYKKDNSPLTLADKQAHSIITTYLEKSGIPILSEEGAEIPYNERKNWKSFWLVDPLDGTKEFINRNGDFTVNIALIQGGTPMAGVIYAPVPDMVYFALPGFGAFKISGNDLLNCNKLTLQDITRSAKKLPEMKDSDEYIIVASRSHQNSETIEFIEKIKTSRNNVVFLSKGSSLKFCALAEGSADIYPRMGPTMEWDTAAGHAIALHAGCAIYDASTHLPLIYNKESLLNPYFVVEREKI
jgi:3'(2'), 5'-bisphosphate nucleotidase